MHIEEEGHVMVPNLVDFCIYIKTHESMLGFGHNKHIKSPTLWIIMSDKRVMYYVYMELVKIYKVFTSDE